MTGEQSPPKTYVIGAGLAGLSAATILAARGVSVTLIEAAGQAGGRCRSYFDSVMDGVIDNGNHLVLSGNRHVRDYARAIGTEAGLVGPARAQFPFVDISTGQRWLLDLLLARGFAAPREPVRVTKLTKLAIIFRYALI